MVTLQKLSQIQMKALDIYKMHRAKNLHKMKEIPVFKNEE